MRQCFPQIRSQVSFHFIFPLDHPVVDRPISQELLDLLKCNAPRQGLLSLLKLRSQGKHLIIITQAVLLQQD